MLEAATPGRVNGGGLLKRIFFLGGTGTIGRATVRVLVERGHEVVCFVRPATVSSKLPEGTVVRFGAKASPTSFLAMAG